MIGVFPASDIFSYSSLWSWLLQVHPGSRKCFDAQEQFLQHPYFIILKYEIMKYKETSSIDRSRKIFI